MKNIQPIYATFELSKLLKEKEWQQRTKMVWLDFLGKQHLREVNLSLELNNAEYDAPEQWQVVEWLRVNHGIWVYADFLGSWMYTIVLLKDNSRREVYHFNLPQEAYSAAFDYILKELI
jgi:hypothetical protein